MKRARLLLTSLALMLFVAVAHADPYEETTKLFKDAGQSASFFGNSYGYALFPTIGKGGFVVGGARGEGHVYQHGKYVGDAKMTELSVGLLAGGAAYSQIIFFEDERAFKEFTSGNFEFGAGVMAVVITASASGEVGGTGKSASASGGKNDAKTMGKYQKGMAVFTIMKGGAMYEASVAGQKFKYTPLASK